MAGLPLSGKNGTLKIGTAVQALILKWNLRKEAVTTRFASNDTPGFKRSIPGVKSAAGSIEFKLDTTASTGGQESLAEGTTGGELKLYIDATRFYDFTVCTFKNFNVDCDINDGTVISGTADFESDGSYVEPIW